MTRRLVWGGLAFGLGLMVSAYAPQPLFAVILFVLAAAAVFVLRKAADIRAWLCLSAYLCGCLLWTGYCAVCVEPLLALDGQTCTFSGEIVRTDAYAGDKARYLLSGTVNGTRAKTICYVDDADCKIGDRVTFTAVFSVPQDSYLFSAADYYAAQGIYLGTEQISDFSVSEDDSFSLRRVIYDYRTRTISAVRRQMSEQEASLLIAMLCGADEGLADSARTALYRTGIGHITAVSGLHLSLLCAAAVWIFRRLRIGKYAEFGAVAVLIALFALFADATASVLRAGLMMLLVYGARLVNRRTDALNSLCAAFVIITLISPYAVKSASFLLSFSATYAVSVLAPYLTRGIRIPPLKSLAEMACVSAAVLPVSVLFFEETSTIAPIANLVLVPLCMLILMLGLLSLATGMLPALSALFLMIAEPLCAAVLRIADFCARLPFSHLPLGYEAYRILLPVLFVSVPLVYFLTRKRSAVQITFVTAALLFCNCAALIPLLRSDEIRVAVLGENGACTVVLTAGDTAEVIDLTGGTDGADYVRKYLSLSGVGKVKTLCLFERPSNAIPVYEDAFCFITVESLYVSDSAPVTMGLSLHGCIPQDAAQCEIIGAGYTLLGTEESAELSVRGAEYRIIPYENGIMIATADGEIEAENTELIISADGTVQLRPL